MVTMVAAGGALAGCADATNASVTDRAAHFYSAIAAGDGPGACADLAPEARTALVDQEGEPCEQAILTQDLREPSGGASARTYGSMAQVQYPGETVFLSRFADGWRVTAAGCPPVDGDEPHTCSVEVG